MQKSELEDLQERMKNTIKMAKQFLAHEVERYTVKMSTGLSDYTLDRL
ncbi:hypothetical protein [Candidatus Williamhamiltonella defendens]|nr:hypothetical protein [Candidatus Hamiltonella defensa]